MLVAPRKIEKNSSESQQISARDTSLDTVSLVSRFDENEIRANRLRTRQTTKEKLSKLYSLAGLSDESAKMKRCCSKFGVLTCGNHIVKNYPTERCRLPLCPDCALFRQNRAYKRLFPKFRQFISENEKDRLVFITLTLKNSSENLLKVHRLIKKSFRRLRQTKSWKFHIRGGIASFELTVSDKGEWHYHLHILALRKSFARYEQADLSNDWLRATKGAGFIVDIRQVRDVQKGFREVLKYNFKPIDITKNRFDTEHLKEFYELCRRSRLAESFGEFYGLDFDEKEFEENLNLEVGSPCPKCNEPLDFIIVGRADLERFYLSVNRPNVGLPMRC